jgi:archaeal flagellar protein FlaI
MADVPLKPSETKLIDTYQLAVNKIVVDIRIEQHPEEPVPFYLISIANISETTKLILEKIRQEFISKLDTTALERAESASENMSSLELLKVQFETEIRTLIKKYFPQIPKDTEDMLVNYLLEENLGLGKIEILLKDPNLEEIVVNSHTEPVWVYHRKHSWLKTNIRILTEARIRHYAMTIGREIGKEITNLSPLMDAHLLSGDRVNATLYPISSRGNTITIRKFAEDPWTITKFIKEGTISLSAAALLWMAVQNELSILIAGGTGSGKTSMLNVIANFFPPNQRVISIEDTRELTLPNTLHWVPLETRLPNPEGKGEVAMLDLLVNSLRMRPDRIIVGEIRRQREAQVLLEAIHTGHSVYATIHANDAHEVITRLTNPPINIPKPMVASLALIVVQNRNRRTGKRRTLQVAETLSTGDTNVLLQHDVYSDRLVKVGESESVIEKIRLYTGMTPEQISKDLDEKSRILKWLILHNMENVDEIGVFFSKYYQGLINIDEL